MPAFQIGDVVRCHCPNIWAHKLTGIVLAIDIWVESEPLSQTGPAHMIDFGKKGIGMIPGTDLQLIKPAKEAEN